MRWWCFLVFIHIAGCLPAFGKADEVVKKVIRTLQTAKLKLPTTFLDYELAEGVAGCSQILVMAGVRAPEHLIPKLVLERSVDAAADKLDGLFEEVAHHFPKKVASIMRSIYLAKGFVKFDLESTESFWQARREVTDSESKIALTSLSLRRGFATSKVVRRLILLTQAIRTGFFLLDLSEADSTQVNDVTLGDNAQAVDILWSQMHTIALEHTIYALVPGIHLDADMQLNVPDPLLAAQLFTDRKMIARPGLREVLSDYFGPKFFASVEDIDAEIDGFMEIWEP